MKKLLSLLTGLFLVVVLTFFVAESAIAAKITFYDTVNFDDVILAEGPIAEIVLKTEHSYNHKTPSDFEVPFDLVHSATLTISGYWIDGSNDQVAVQRTVFGNLKDGGYFGKYPSWSNWNLVWVSYDKPSVTSFDISSLFDSWETGADLGVIISAAGSWGDGILELSKSVFELKYETGVTPTPEPATLALFGFGLLGLAGISRKKS